MVVDSALNLMKVFLYQRRHYSCIASKGRFAPARLNMKKLIMINSSVCLKLQVYVTFFLVNMTVLDVLPPQNSSGFVFHLIR